MRLVELTEQLRDVRSGIIVQLEPLAADVAFRGDDRMLMDLVWELLWPDEADEWLARLLWTDDPDLGPVPSWQTRKRRMIDRYWHALQVVIDFADTLTEADLVRTARRSDGQVTLAVALQTTVDHDRRYSAMLRDRAIPLALAATPLAPLPPPGGGPLPDAVRRRDAAARVVDGWADRLGSLLEPVTAAQSFEGRGQRLADHLMHCSYRPVLTENVKRIMREDNPDLGTLASPDGFWDYLRPALVHRLRAHAARWRSFDEVVLYRGGHFSDGGRLIVMQAIEAELFRVTTNLSALSATLRPD